MMALNRVILIVLVPAALLLAGCQITPRDTRPSLGQLEHRGRRYALRDLASQAYRQASDDPFVRNFDPQMVYAGGEISPECEPPCPAAVRVPALMSVGTIESSR